MGSRNAQPGQRSGILGAPVTLVRVRHPLASRPSRTEHDIQYGIAERTLRLAVAPLHPPISLLIGKFDIGLAGAWSTTVPPTLPSSVEALGYIEAPSCLDRTVAVPHAFS